MIRFSILLPLVALTSCTLMSERRSDSSPTYGRSVEKGHLVFAAKSEGAALDDLANECSFVPRGARIEERSPVAVKVGVAWNECEIARKTMDPDAIRAMASPDLSSTSSEETEAPVGFVEYHPDEGAVEVEVTPTPIADDANWFAARQQIAVAKREIITADPEIFAPGSEERDRFLRAVEPAQGRIAAYASSNPRVVTTTWSGLPHRPRPLPPLGMPVYRPAPQPPTLVEETPPPERKPAAKRPNRHKRPRRQKR